MPELWLGKILSAIMFLNSNMPEKRYKILKKMKLMIYLITARTYFSVICLTDTQIVQLRILKMVDIDRLISYALQSSCHSVMFYKNRANF